MPIKKIPLSAAALLLTCAAITPINAHQHSGDDSQDNRRCPPELAAPHATNSPAKHAKRKNTVTKLYNGLIYPAPKAVLEDPANAANIFEQAAIKGRVTPAGEYDDFEGAIEYFYGLALTPASRVDGIKVRSIVASDDKVAVEVDLHFCGAPYTGCDTEIADGGNNKTIRQTGFYTFNKNDKIVSFDLTILNLGKFSNVSTEEAKMQNIIGVCTMLTTAHFNVITESVAFSGTCTDKFDNVNDFPAGFPATEGSALNNCIAFMKSIPYGTWDQPASNTFTCRSLHSLLTPFRD
ncbi:MAG: Pithovirus sibericum, partial [Pseudomonadota bacterium]